MRGERARLRVELASSKTVSTLGSVSSRVSREGSCARPSARTRTAGVRERGVSSTRARLRGRARAASAAPRRGCVTATRPWRDGAASELVRGGRGGLCRGHQLLSFGCTPGDARRDAPGAGPLAAHHTRRARTWRWRRGGASRPRRDEKTARSSWRPLGNHTAHVQALKGRASATRGA